MSRDQNKAARYIKSLDEARTNSDWAAVPELARKIRKHTPERTCLALTAECEHAVVQAAQARPSTAASLDATGLTRLVAPLTEAIEKERKFPEDKFQAQVCLAWLYWFLDKPTQALAQLPNDIEQEFSRLEGTGKELAEWTRTCTLKASFIKGDSQSKLAFPGEALKTFTNAIPILSVTSTISGNGESRLWTELLLTQFCVLSGHAIRDNLSPVLEAETLFAFRMWAEFWQRQSGRADTVTGGYAPQSRISRRHVWKEYYATLSFILQQNLPYPITGIAATYTDTATRNMQRAELGKVEKVYEHLLLKEIQFPKAEEASEEIDEWISLVMQNWRLLSGSAWQEYDLGEGGREGVSRGVLNILYRAATKTFHSTQILRYLFTVHLVLAEFDLAFKAFDTYFEIVTKGKARVEKSGEPEHGLDDDETVLQTASECIKALCQYGSHTAAEKAKDLAQYFQVWLEKHYPSHDNGITANGSGNGNIPQIENGGISHGTVSVAPQVLANAWCAIGISKAQWARLTFDAALRPEIQLEAIHGFRKALSPEFESADNIDTLFALAIVLAERRELGPAIEVVKAALLSPSSGTKSNNGLLEENFARERSLIPLWHLLALLLSAKQEFTTAARACEGAFEQFKDPKNLFGETGSDGNYRSEHLNGMELKPLSEKNSSVARGIVDDMDESEKETVLEVKMTQLVLLEVLEGPEVAVNASDELLSLYTRLFGEPQNVRSTTQKAAQLLPPQSSAGTLRSIKGSIFGRSRRSVRHTSGASQRSGPVLNEKGLAMRPTTSQTVASTATHAPTIHITSDNSGAADPTNHHHEKLQKRNNSLSRKKSAASTRDRSTSARRSRDVSGSSIAHRPASRDAEKAEVSSQFSSPPHDPDHPEQWLDATRYSQVGLAISPDNLSPSPVHGDVEETQPRSLSHTSHNMKQQDSALKFGNGAQKDTRLPTTTATAPITRFSKEQTRRHRIGILIKVWLLIAGFYRRAEMYEDAKGAIGEATKLVEDLEMSLTRADSGNSPEQDPGWGVTKHVGELWADIWSERGYLSTAKAAPHVALSEFESALGRFADHPSAIVGISNLLLDIYSEVLFPLSTIPALTLPETSSTASSATLQASTFSSKIATPPLATAGPSSVLPSQGTPLGAPRTKSNELTQTSRNHQPFTEDLDLPHKPAPTTLLDRLAARDRAYGLLNGLTKLGTGWNYSEAWFALARAYEEGGQIDKAREVLWWCVELEEAKPVRDWRCVSPGGYVL